MVVVLLWASTFVVAKSAFTELSPLAFTFVRFVLMIALAVAVLVVRQPGHLRGIDRADWGRLALVGLSGYTFYQLGFVLGLDRTSPFSSSLLIAMVPLFTVLLLALKGEPTPLRAGSDLAWLSLAS